jgi:hypothetical protein
MVIPLRLVTPHPRLRGQSTSIESDRGNGSSQDAASALPRRTQTHARKVIRTTNLDFDFPIYQADKQPQSCMRTVPLPVAPEFSLILFAATADELL